MLRTLLVVAIAASQCGHAGILRVSEGAGGAGNGSSWVDAFPKLQDAIAAAVAGDEIWVAAGAYYPDERTGQPDGTASASFNIPRSVPLYGGFARTETLRSQRNPAQNVTILSGDIGQDDANADGKRIAETTAGIVGTNSTTVLRFMTSTGTARIDGFTITAGSATGTNGGGLRVGRSTLTVTSCHFSGNRATYGGAVSNESSGTLFTNCIFSGNSATQDGGAFRNNSVAHVTNCLFHSNSAGHYGGAWYETSGSPVITHCTFTGNSAQLGGAVGVDFGQPAFRNSILWGNTATASTAVLAGSVTYSISGASFANCIVAGSGTPWSSPAGSNGGGNLDADPKFLSPTPPFPLASFRLISGSPAINSGKASFLPTDASDIDDDGNISETLPVDLAGDSRSDGVAPDMGVFEAGGPTIASQPPVVRLLPNSGTHSSALDLSDHFDATAVAFSHLAPTPSNLVTVTVDPVTGGMDFTPAPNATGTAKLIVAASNSSGKTNYLLLSIEIYPPAFFVDADATGAATGLSWADAFPTIQDALAKGGSSHEIRVAEGVYYPDNGSGQTPGSTSARFTILPGVTLLGGFAGTEATAAEADPVAHPTVLSGDVGRDDLNTDGNHVAETVADRVGTNSTAVVVLSGAPAGSGIDGFIVTAAGASGGLRISGGSPFVRRCHFQGNSGGNGGAVSSDGAAAPSFTGCHFTNNHASSAGGAVRCSTGSPSFVDCVFTGNIVNGTATSGGALDIASATVSLRRCTFLQNQCLGTFSDGGAVRASGSGLTASECLFQENSAYDGGALILQGSTLVVTLTHCRMLRNSARSDGGAIYGEGININYAGCEFAANRSVLDGGAIYHNGCASAALAQCTLAGNAAGSDGGAFYTYQFQDDAAPTFRNCVIWNNRQGTGSTASGHSVVSYSSNTLPATFSHCLIAHSGGSASWNPELGTDGGGNRDADPRFLLPPDPLVTGPQAIDLRLQAGSPAINAGNSTLLPPDATDLDGDGNTAEPCPIDLTGKPRGVGTSVDIGAYEAEPGPALIATAPRLRFDTLSGTHSGVLQIGSLFAGSGLTLGIEATSSTSIVSTQASSGALSFTVVPDAFGTTLVVVKATNAAGFTSYHTVIVDVFPPVVFVDASATGNATGLSWEHAFPTLQAALKIPRIEGIPLEVWVANGVYYPDEGPGQTANAAASAFRLTTGCRLYGGFAGGETQRTARNPLQNPSILSGDLAQDDSNGDANFIAETTAAIIGANAKTVVIAEATGADDVLDGFVITAGGDLVSTSQPGGYWASGCVVKIRDCRFLGNRAINGGAIHLLTCDATFSGCEFTGNAATYVSYHHTPTGGAANFVSSSVTMTSCRFEGNRAASTYTNSSGNGGAIACSDGASLSLVDCDFAGNTTAGDGGSLSVSTTPLLLENCHFTGPSTLQWAAAVGGAVSCSNSPATIVRCEFSNTHAGRGGAIIFEGSQPLGCVNTSFQGNSAGYQGGAVEVATSLPVRFTNCLFSGNSSGVHGGAIYNYRGDAIYAHCTFTGNRANADGGAVFQEYNPAPFARFDNCILWNNASRGSALHPKASIATGFYSPMPAIFTNSLVAGSGGSSSWSANFGTNGGGNLDIDPRFLASPLPGDAPTVVGDARLQRLSPARGAGSNTSIPADTLDLDDDGNTAEALPFDRANGPRVKGTIVDMGAFETGEGPATTGDPSRIERDPHSGSQAGILDLKPQFDSTATSFQIDSIIQVGPIGSVTATVGQQSGLLDLVIAPDTVGRFYIIVKASDSSGRDSLRPVVVDVFPPVLYVKKSATGQANGLSWSNAFPSLQQALALGGSGYEIWMAGGTYTPDQIKGDRLTSFYLREGVAVRGGFAGTESDPSQRVASSPPTILSGDVGGDDVDTTNDGIPEDGYENSSTVVFASGVPASAMLERVTISSAWGAGLQVTGSSPSVRDCIFSGSFGAMRVEGNSAPVVERCHFIRNYGSVTGAALYLADTANPVVSNCVFAGNLADSGSAVYNAYARASFINCTFSGNRSRQPYGGAIATWGETSLKNCIIWNNRAAFTPGTPTESVYRGTGTCTYNHCIIANSGGSGAWNSEMGTDLGNNLDLDPVFLTPANPSTAPLFSGDLQLAHGSPALDSGDNAAAPATTDLLGAPRIVNGTVDRGAYEGQNDQLDTDGDGLSDAFELAANTGTSRISLDPQADLDGDGFDNLMEFALGFDPATPNPPMLLSPKWTEQAGQRFLSIRYQRNRWAAQYLDIGVERSTDLGTGDSWSTGETTEMTITPVGPMVDEVETRSNIPLTSQNREFLRVRAAKSAPSP